MWLASLQRAQQLSRDEVTLSLLTEFPTIRTDDYSQELLSTGLPLMFSMLVTSKVQLSPSPAPTTAVCCFYIELRR